MLNLLFPSCHRVDTQVVASHSSPPCMLTSSLSEHWTSSMGDIMIVFYLYPSLCLSFVYVNEPMNPLLDTLPTFPCPALEALYFLYSLSNVYSRVLLLVSLIDSVFSSSLLLSWLCFSMAGGLVFPLLTLGFTWHPITWPLLHLEWFLSRPPACPLPSLIVCSCILVRPLTMSRHTCTCSPRVNLQLKASLSRTFRYPPPHGKISCQVLGSHHGPHPIGVNPYGMQRSLFGTTIFRERGSWWTRWLGIECWTHTQLFQLLHAHHQLILAFEVSPRN